MRWERGADANVGVSVSNNKTSESCSTDGGKRLEFKLKTEAQVKEIYKQR